MKQVQVPWARAGSGFTFLFEALVMIMVRDMPVNVMARLFAVTETRLWRVINAYVEMARAKEDYSGVRRVGMDETSVKRGHDYVTFFFDLDGKKLLFGTEGNDNQTVKEFVTDLKQHGGNLEQITDAAIDMSKAFIKGVKEQLPNAETTFDPFHVIKSINNALAKIRAEEARLFPEVLSKNRYLFLHNPENLSPEEQKRLDAIIASQNLKSTEAYLHKLNLQNVYFAESRLEAETLLICWHREASTSSISLIQKMAKMVKEHWNGILSHFDSKLSTGFLEGINSLIQAAVARARGYRNPRNLISMAYIIASKLKFKSLHTVPI